MNNQVIPQVGQVWQAYDNGNKITITSVLGCTVVWDSISSPRLSGTIYDNLIHSYYTFVPANDLEWLAVNACKWNDGYTVIERAAKQDVAWSNHVFGEREYTKQQWQECRNKLFGEVKMGTQTVKYWDGVSAIEVGDVYLDSDGQACKLYAKPAFNDSTMFIGHAYEHPDCSGLPCVSVAMQSVCSKVDQRTEEDKLIDVMTGIMYQCTPITMDNAKTAAGQLVREFNIIRKDK